MPIDATSSPLARSGARLHALDNLRAILMWLGVVLHVAVIYGAAPAPNSWHDEGRTILADVLTSAIHAFRMPAFFILAGFFAALLARSRGPGGLLRHRLARLALPFALFWPVIWVATVLAALAFLNRMVLGHWGLDRGAITPDLPLSLRPGTFHMWFLWMLLWFCIATSLLLRLPRRWFAPASASLAWLARRPWGFAVLALPLLAAGARYPGGFLVPSGSFLPPWNEWLHNGVFFVFGLMLHGRQTELFALYESRWRRFAAAGLVFYLGAMVMHRSGAALPAAYSYHCAGWLWSFCSIGLALRWLNSRHAVLGYLSDSAYWVYLLHYPFTILFGALLFQLPVPVLAKIAINIASTTLVCVGSYQLFVRHTWVSNVLNGKRHPRPARGMPLRGGLR